MKRRLGGDLADDKYNSATEILRNYSLVSFANPVPFEWKEGDYDNNETCMLKVILKLCTRGEKVSKTLQKRRMGFVNDQTDSDRLREVLNETYSDTEL